MKSAMPLFLLDNLLKVSRWKKLLFINSHHTAILNFLFLSLCVYLFKKCPSQFLSHWELAGPVFCSEELSCLLYKKLKQNPRSSSLAEKYKFVFQIQVLFDQCNKSMTSNLYSTKSLLALVCHFRMSEPSNCNRLT